MLRVPAALLAVLVAGCVVDPVEPELGSTAGITFEQFAAQTAREPGTGHYVVDWDHIVRGEAELRAFYDQFQQGGLAIHTSGGVDVKWGPAQQRNLTYCISDAFGAQKAAVVEAMARASESGWELFANVNFIYVPAQDATCTAANTAVLFDIRPITGAPYAARAFFPDSPRSERNVMIDGTAFTANVPLQNIVAHELGHVLGFRHEHIRPEAGATSCLEDTQFRPLTTYDSASVMHYPQCNGTSATMAFTARDQQGVAAIYGAPGINAVPMAQVTSPMNGATVSASFQVQASVVDTDLMKAELFIDGVLAQTLTAPPFVFQVTNLAAGPHTLELAGTDANNQTGRQTIAITVGAAGGGGSGPTTLTDDEITGGCASSSPRSAWLALGFALLVARRLRRGR